MKALISLIITIILVFMLGVSVGSNIGIEIGCINGIFESMKFKYDMNKSPSHNYNDLKNKCENE